MFSSLLFSSCVACRNITGWTIHGLWPERDDGTWPQFCDPKNPFNINDVSDLLTQMEGSWLAIFFLQSPVVMPFVVQWIDDEEPNNSSALWSHEWGEFFFFPLCVSCHDF